MYSFVHSTRASVRFVIVMACMALLVVLPYIIKTFQEQTSKTLDKPDRLRLPQEDVLSTAQSDMTLHTEEHTQARELASQETANGLAHKQNRTTLVIAKNSLQPTGESNVQEEMPKTQPDAGSEPAIEAYCMKCRQNRNMFMPRQVTTKNGRNAMEGTCPICNTRLFRFIK